MSERRSRAGVLLLVLWPGLAAADEAPLTLVDAMRRAADRAPEIAVYQAAQEEADAGVRLAQAMRRPHLRADTGPGWAVGVPAPILGQLPSIVGVHVSQTLYDDGRRAEEQELKEQLAGARGDLRSARRRAAQAAAESFARCQLYDALVESGAARAAALARARARSEALLAEGRATDLDLMRARLREAEARQAQNDTLAKRELELMQLRRLVDWPAAVPLALVHLSEPPPLGPGDDLASARAVDPTIRALADQIEAQRRALQLRGRLLQPVVEATAQYARLYKTADWDAFYSTFKPDSWSIGAQINVPLWSGGRQGADEARAQATLDRLLAQQRVRDGELEQEARSAQLAETGAAERLEVGRLAEGVAAEALRVASAVFAEGRLDPAELADSEVAAASARQDLARSEAERLLARLRRLALRGELPDATAP